MKILIDADMIVFQACAVAEKEIDWGNGIWTLHSDIEEVKNIINERVQSLIEKVLGYYNYEGFYDIIMCFSGNNNFRYKILPTYKFNRAGKRKPVCYIDIKEWVMDNYNYCLKDNLEADDCLGILGTLYKDVIIVSGDKDMKQIPCRFYDFSHDIFYDHTESEADYWFYYQCLVGDNTDGYSGCPSIGDKTAIKLLDAEGASWDTVINAYSKKKLSEEEALRQARVARILRKSDYNFVEKQPILWQPRRCDI